MTFFTILWEGIIATSIIEWIAVISSLIYVVLAAKRLMFCWIFAFIGSVLFVYLCFVANLYIESILQLFYVFMAFVGWLSWKRADSDGSGLKIWSSKNHLLNVFVCGFIALVVGFLFDNYTLQANPYIDAFTTCYSLSATFMVARKIIGNWVYWIVIDLVSIYLYADRGYYLTAVQYGIFTLLATYGFWAWQKEYKRQKLC